MRKLHLRIVFLAVLVAVAGSLLTAAPAAWADGCEGSSCTGFKEGEYEVWESAGYVQLQVSAAWCCPVGQGAIDYHTADLTAVAGQDYKQTSGTLTYTGHGGNSIRVPITSDGLFEGEERFEVRLTNFRGTFVNRGRETAVVRILDDDDPKRSSGNSASPGQSNQQTARSQASSLAGRPSQPSEAASSSGSTDVGNQSDSVMPDDLPRPGEPVALDGAEPFVGKAVPDDNRPSSLPVAGSGALLLVLIAAGFGLKKRLGRKLT